MSCLCVTVRSGRRATNTRLSGAWACAGLRVGVAPGISRSPDRGSVRLDLAEAVRAVDRLVHAGLERHLRLVTARRADGREVLAGTAVVRALVAPGATERVRVVAAAIAGRPAVGPAR